MSGRYDLAGGDDGSAFGALTGAGATGFCVGGVGRFGTGGKGGRLLPGGATLPSTRVNSLGPAACPPIDCITGGGPAGGLNGGG